MGKNYMELGASLFEFCPLIDISIWNNRLRFSNYDDVERYSPLENTYIKEMTIQSGKVPTFRGCKVLKKVTFLEDCGVTTIGDYLFYNCVSLTEVVLCRSIRSIGVKAFKYTNISYFDFTNIYQFDLTAFNMSKLKEIVLNYNILIGDDIAKQHLENNICFLQHLEKVIINSRVTDFTHAYFNNPNLKEFIVTDNPKFASIDKVIYTSNQETLYAYPAGLEAREFTVPYIVKTIKPYSFAYCSNLETINVGSNVIVSNGMFRYCTSVKSIKFTAPTYYFAEGCFAFCSNLTSIIIPETSVVTQLFSHCFHGCVSLQSLNFNNKLEIVDSSCFEKCISLSDVDLSLLKEISDGCFKNACQSQINMHLSDKIRSIGNSAFENSKIVEFTCPKNLLYIGQFAFLNCIDLKTFKFNDAITEICNKTFCNVGINEVFIPDSLKIIQPSSFSEGGHPKFYVENDCFMTKANELIFIIRRDQIVFDLPSNVKMFGKGSINESNYSRIIINSEISDSVFLTYEKKDSKLCVKSFTNNSCHINISDVNNIDRYAKEGEYEPTYKLSNGLYIEDSFIHISEYITGSTVYQEFPQKSLVFFEDIRTNSILEVSLIVFVSILLIIILILAIIAVNESRRKFAC